MLYAFYVILTIGLAFLGQKYLKLDSLKDVKYGGAILGASFQEYFYHSFYTNFGEKIM